MLKTSKQMAKEDQPDRIEKRQYQVKEEAAAAAAPQHQMQTRSKTKSHVEYAQFERTVNLLLLLSLKEL